jgi:hypothetical protein
MPGDPQECRQHALHCVELAEHASTPKARQTFLDLSETWLRLARELDGAQAFLNAMNGIEVKAPIEGIVVAGEGIADLSKSA